MWQLIKYYLLVVT